MSEAFWTFPKAGELQRFSSRTPDFMRPSLVPYVAGIEGYLSDEECDRIVESLGALEGYSSHGCAALTRECSSDPSLDPIEAVARSLNEVLFGFDLDPGQHSWMQTYEVGDKYQRHMDDSPGQNRKMTAVAMLTDSNAYSGGHLTAFIHPRSYVTPRTRGSVVVFPGWVEHEVSPMTHGRRQTINMGFWGPSFR